MVWSSSRSDPRSLPDSEDGAGYPAPAELVLLDDTGRGEPERLLGVLAVSAGRIGRLPGRVAEAFTGARANPPPLGPEWTAGLLTRHAADPMADFAAVLLDLLLARAHRVALAKTVLRRNGTWWHPTRVHERGGLLWSTGSEGRGNVGLRLDRLIQILAGTGVLVRGGDRWMPGPRWQP
jgi:hypothetical protein